ncbi:MAG TPA: nucleotide sugar dehydrogenase [Steroidobacter sp.]
MSIVHRESQSRRPVVCVQGLGFVGTAMAIATAAARDAQGSPCYEVIGVDLPTPSGSARVAAINAGELGLNSTDPDLQRYLGVCREQGNLSAATDENVYARADVVLVDVHLDVESAAGEQPHVDFTGFKAAIATLGRHLQPGALVIVETTVPPGTCEHVVIPTLAAELRRRGLPEDALLVAHSYERVMPGRDYLKSITNFWRVYSGATPAAAEACERFLSRVINIAEYPLTRLPTMAASETAKILENSYRATNIAFIHEWGRFAERAGVDLFAVLDAIRMRPTHNNIRQPGFGVGGYCLTKDPAFVMVSSAQLLGFKDLDFPFCRLAMRTNAEMPLHSLERLRGAFGGNLSGRRILVLGVSYRQDVGDTRYSPTEVFVRAAEQDGATVVAHDPLVSSWPELNREVASQLPDPKPFDAVVLAVPHREYAELDMAAWLAGSNAIMLDTNHVLSSAQIAKLNDSGRRPQFIGRGS